MQRRLYLTPRQVNLLLEILVLAAIVSGLVSWVVPLSSARVVTVVHAIVGLLILAVTPLKAKGSVRTGLRRGRRSRWVSVAFGLLVLGTIALGVAHVIGSWFGTGLWTPLWTHLLLGFITIPLLIWHVLARPVRPKLTDLDRRGFLTTSVAAAVSGAVLVTQEVTLDAFGFRGGERAGTGSIETASFNPAAMPQVQWLNDRAPQNTSSDDWPLSIEGEAVSINSLVSLARPVTARLDCTGGWHSIQNWDAVALSELLGQQVANRPEARSIKVTSETGYSRLYSVEEAGSLFLAVGYNGEQLLRGHGAPVRVVAPNRRGPNWVKWVVDVKLSNRPAWLQLPLPPT